MLYIHSPSWPTCFATSIEHKNRAELQNNYVAVNETLLELALFLISKDNLEEQNPKPKESFKKGSILRKSETARTKIGQILIS